MRSDASKSAARPDLRGAKDAKPLCEKPGFARERERRVGLTSGASSTRGKTEAKPHCALATPAAARRVSASPKSS
jgi:hypothetical protein